MKRTTIALILTAAALLPASAEAQQDPAKVGEGAQVYAATCARCHNARSGTERTDAEWGLIVAHMRARANMTRGQAEAVLAFLQATNLPEPGTATSGGTGTEAASMVALPEELRHALMASWLRQWWARGEVDDPPGGS